MMRLNILEIKGGIRLNKNIKKVIAIALSIGTIGTIAPEAGVNLFGTARAYADSSDGVTSLRVKSSSGSTLNLYTDSSYESKDKVDNDSLESGKAYYAKTAADGVEVSVSGVDSDCVRVFKGTSDSDKGKRAGDEISISETTTIVVRIYASNPGTVKYGNDDYVSQYRIKVKYTGSEDDDDDEVSDNVYLKSISLSSGSLTFDKKTSIYDVNVDEEINKVEIAARPDCDSDEYDDYKVKINGTRVDEDDKFKEEVKLNEGKNVIEIRVEDDDDNVRTYTLNINRGKVTETNNSSDNQSNNASAENKTNQWVQMNGKWQYKDGAGNPVKNTWVQDYYVQADGNMATGWLNYGSNWYYLGGDGAKKTGWQLVNGYWYYLGTQGAMQTGWIVDRSNGKYYYLNSNGSMAYNTTIDGYKLGHDGAWIGK